MLYAQHPLSEIPQGFVTANAPLPYARHLFGTREQSQESSEETIHALIERFGPMGWMQQVHGNRVTRVEGPGRSPECDAIFTDNPNLWLAVQTADCVPVLISSPHAVAAVHAGWRSAESGILPRTMEAMCAAFAMAPEDLHMAFGPALSQPNFEVEKEFIARFEGQYGVRHAERFFDESETTKGKKLMDLTGLLMAQATANGALDIHLTRVPHCTYADEANYHSYRRFTHRQKAGVSEPCWRQISLIRRLGTE